MSNMRQFLVCTTLLVLYTVNPASANGSSCGSHVKNAATIFNAEKTLGTAPNPKTTSLEEHQILFVKTWRAVVSSAVLSSAKPDTIPGLALFINGKPSPSSQVTNAVIEFRPVGAKLRRANYVKARKQIRFFLPVNYYEAFIRSLKVCAPIYMQYRRYSNGHIFADIHHGALPVYATP